MKTLRNGLPALAVLVLLALALLAPARGVRAEKPLAEAAWLTYYGCATLVSGGAGATPNYALPFGESVVQPFGPVGNVVSCSLAVQPLTYNSGRLDVVGWDPATLAPTPGSIALRTFDFSCTGYSVNVSQWYQMPPIVTKSLPTVAEAGPAEVALRLTSFAGTNTETISIDPNDPSSAPAARRMLANGTTTVLPGAHPVTFFQACGGDAAAQAFEVMQSVVSPDAYLDGTSYEFVQRFRVPVATRIAWFELAVNPYNGQYPISNATVSVCDAEGQATPPASFPFALFLTNLSPYWGKSGPTWASTWDAMTNIVLQPHHDYWLVVTTDRDFSLSGKIVGANTDPHFQNSIGELYRRWQQGATAELVPARAMDFRLIGTPEGTVGVTPLAPARAGLALRVWPNPAYGVTSFEWSGARGATTLEVLDARGRRVVSPTRARDASGRLAWACRGDDGAALPAGVYFVRARDEAGRTASVRVTIVR